METVIFLDTHVVVWLYAGEVGRFPNRARKKLETEPLLISPMVLLEIQYLHELSRVSQGPALIVKELEKSLGLDLHTEDFERTIVAALMESWTRDPFDRIITAHAHLAAAPLLTKDESIRKHYRQAFWD
ncbi:MAG: type II toxin-antitoxin system VapC family toxin [Verrucomicrobia bacterium]|nr:type II toxin-antitoxin system VapC family toxin [Verrucomicrobiota bacterium]